MLRSNISTGFVWALAPKHRNTDSVQLFFSLSIFVFLLIAVVAFVEVSLLRNIEDIRVH